MSMTKSSAASPRSSGLTNGDLDPYAAWLELPEGSRPPDAYALLRLPRYEASHKLILAARDRQRRALDAVRGSAPPDLWERVSREVQQAAERLLSEKSRRIIDSQLRRRELATGKGLAPEQASAASVQCGCGHANVAQATFCKSCGATLWELCSDCGQPAGVDEKFCGSCGTNLKEAHAAATAKAQAALADGARALEAKSFRRAHELLYAAALPVDPRLSDIADEAVLLLERLERRREEERLSASQALPAAARLLAEHRFQQAIELLEGLSQEAITEDHEALLQQARTSSSRVQSLRNEVRRQLDGKQLAGLGARIDELLNLDPGDADIAPLAEKLAAQLVRKAAHRIKEGQFQAARTLLAEVPVSRIDDHVRKLESIIDEVLWVAEDVQTSPIVDNALPGLIDRWKKIDPGKAPTADQLQAELRNKRWGQAWRPGEVGAVNPPPVLDLPLAEPRWDLADTPRLAEWRQARSLFAVALGLGLQALEKGVFRVNLLENKNDSLLGRWMGKPKAVQEAWAVDLGESSLKAVRLALAEDGRVRITDWHYAVHDGGRPGLEPSEQAHRIRDCLRTLGERIPKGATLAVGCPAHEFILRTKTIPLAVKGRKGDAALAHIARETFPLDLEQLVWRHQPLESLDAAPGAPALFLATRRELLQRRLQVFEDADLHPTLAECDAAALFNLASYEWMQIEDADRRLPVLFIDFGHGASKIVMAEPDNLQYRSLPIGGRQVAEAICKEFQTTWEATAKIQRNPLLVKSLSRLQAAVQPAWRHLAKEVEKSLHGFHRASRGEKPRAVFAVGGGFLQHGALREFYAPKAER